MKCFGRTSDLATSTTDFLNTPKREKEGKRKKTELGFVQVTSTQSQTTQFKDDRHGQILDTRTDSNKIYKFTDFVNNIPKATLWSCSSALQYNLQF